MLPEYPVVFAACDAEYYKKHAPAFISSCQSIGKDVHVHVHNHDQECIELHKKLYDAVDGIKYSMSTGQTDISKLNAEQTRTFYACIRFHVAPMILEKCGKMLITDIDCVFMKDFEYPEQSIGYYPRTPLEHTTGWENAGTRVAAGVVYFSKEALQVAKDVSAVINKLPLQWFNDQIALSEVIGEIDNKKVYHFGPDFMDWEFGDDATIWTGKGHRKFSNESYRQVKQEFANKLIKSDEDVLSVVVFKWKPLEDQLEFIPTQIGDSKVDYGVDHVNFHYHMLKMNLKMPFRYILITDEISPEVHGDIIQLPLWDKHRELGGCFHRLFTFSKEFEQYVGKRFVSMDLDMIITGDLTALFNNDKDFVYYKMRGGDGTGWRMNNGMYMMNTGARSFVWEQFDADPKKVMDMRVGPGTDQGVTNALLDLDKEYHWIQGDGILDMRQDFIEAGRVDLPQNTRIVMWPGPRDPMNTAWREKFPWINYFYPLNQ